MTESFRVTTGVKQGCLLSPMLFTLAMNWIMKETTRVKKRGIRWTLTSVLEDLDYADDVGLLSSSHKDMQEKTTRMKETSELIGLKVNKKKTKVMRINSKRNDAIRIDDQDLEDVEEFDYLGSRTTADGDATSDVKARLSKARHAFAGLKNIWQARNISISTKIRLFKSNILSILLYGSETWKVTNKIIHQLETFQNRCLRRILRIFWPNKISNEDLRKRADVKPVEQEVRSRRWRWIGHVNRMEKEAVPRIALRWTPDGKRKRGRPKETWRRTVEREMKENKMTWDQTHRLAQDRGQWREFVEAFCATSATRIK